MLEDKNDIRLLYQSIQELASEMGQSQLNTKTVSLIFLEMDAASTSICTILQFCANVLNLPVIRSLKRVPMEIITSQSVMATFGA